MDLSEIAFDLCSKTQNTLTSYYQCKTSSSPWVLFKPVKPENFQEIPFFQTIVCQPFWRICMYKI